MDCSGKVSSWSPANRGAWSVGGSDASLEVGVDEPSRPESSTTVSESESVPGSEVSRVGGGSSTEGGGGALFDEDWRGEFKGDRIR